jgi:plasmid stabilization system protein ParE
VTFELRWTEHAVDQLGAIAEYIAVASPVYADQVVERIVFRLRQAQTFPESGRRVPEAPDLELRELIEAPYRIVYQAAQSTIVVIAIIHGRQDLPQHVQDSPREADIKRALSQTGEPG